MLLQMLERAICAEHSALPSSAFFGPTLRCASLPARSWGRRTFASTLGTGGCVQRIDWQETCQQLATLDSSLKTKADSDPCSIMAT